jgi:hypothetical protein
MGRFSLAGMLLVKVKKVFYGEDSDAFHYSLYWVCGKNLFLDLVIHSCAFPCLQVNLGTRSSRDFVHSFSMFAASVNCY